MNKKTLTQIIFPSLLAALIVAGIVNATILGDNISTNGTLSSASNIMASGTISAIGGITSDGNISAQSATFNGNVFKKTTITTIDSDGDATYSAQQMINGFIKRTNTVDGADDTTASAADIIAAIPGAEIGSSFRFFIKFNRTGGGSTFISPGSGVTLDGTTESNGYRFRIANGKMQEFLLIVDNVSSPAVTIYRIWSDYNL